MIIEKKEPLHYGKFFLAFEADDEEPTKSNIKRIEIKQNNRGRRVDFTTDIDDDNSEPEEDEESETDDTTDEINGDDDTEVNDEPSEGDSDEMDENPEAMEAENEEQPSEEPESDEGQAMDENPENMEDTSEEPESDENTTSNDEQTDNLDSDENPDAGSQEGEEPGEDTDEQPDEPEEGEDGESFDQSQDGESGNGPGLEYDSMRQYRLFMSYDALHTSLSNYISNLEIVICDDISSTRIFTQCIDRLRTLRELVYDYMIMKFTSSSYVQNLLFYQKIYESTQMIISTLIKSTKTKK